MVDDPALVEDMFFQLFRSYLHLILSALILIPSTIIATYAMKSIINKEKLTKHNRLTEPLLGKNEKE